MLTHGPKKNCLFLHELIFETRRKDMITFGLIATWLLFQVLFYHFVIFTSVNPKQAVLFSSMGHNKYWFLETLVEI